jgi:GTP-binding protein HflX
MHGPYEQVIKERPVMSKPSQSNAVLVAIRTPRVTVEELDSSLQELTRLVNTLGYRVVGRVTQKRSSDQYAAVLGQGKLAELALWTGGSGKIESAFERPKHKAASKREAAASDVTDESDDEDESDDTIEALPRP